MILEIVVFNAHIKDFVTFEIHIVDLQMPFKYAN